MIAVDTNVVVRFLVGDDPVQARLAKTLFAASRVAVPHTVLLETEWVLRRRYRFAREQIATAFGDLLGMGTVSCLDDEAVRIAVDAFAQGCDFADAMHAATAGPATSAFATFDKVFARQARDMKHLPPIRLLDQDHP